MNDLFFITAPSQEVIDDGIIVALVGYVVVFVALVLLYGLFFYLPKILQYNIRQKLRKEGKEKCADTNLNISADVNAAISTALYLYFEELHDEESGLMTIKKVSKQYSPWSSKIHGLNHGPRN